MPDPAGVATALVGALIGRDYPSVRADFDARMLGGLAVGQVAEVWGQVESQAGTPIRAGAMEAESAEGHEVVRVTCDGPRASFVVQVSVDLAGKVAGLYILPKAVPHPAPPYADGGAFAERPFRVGSGEWATPGTLALPRRRGLRKRAAPPPAVVCVHGSGPNDRDETVGGSKVFLDLAWGLATRGIAVLRYEKRTRIHGARMDPGAITVREETIEDALAAVEGLRAFPEIDPERVLLLGHSLGGTLAPAMGAEDPRIAGLVILAGSTRPIEEHLVRQLEYLVSIGRAGSAEIDAARKHAARIRRLTPTSKVSAKDLPMGMPARYWLSLRAHDPLEHAARAKQPMLVLQGERDYQVTMADFEGWKHALAGRTDVGFKSYARLNHLFAEGDGSSTPDEYLEPANVAAEVVSDVAGWILTTLG